MDLFWYYMTKKRGKSRITTEFKEVKSTDSSRVIHKYQLVVRLKAIGNIMGFSYLFIFCTFYP